MCNKMKVLFATFTVWIFLVSEASALQCYSCNSTSFNPTPGCHDEAVLSPSFLDDCDQGHCGVLKVQGQMNGYVIVSYTRSCQPVPTSGCAPIPGRPSLTGCFYSCQSDGCNGISILPITINNTPLLTNQSETTTESEIGWGTETETTANPVTSTRPDETTLFEVTEQPVTPPVPDETTEETSQIETTTESYTTTGQEETTMIEVTTQPIGKPVTEQDETTVEAIEETTQTKTTEEPFTVTGQEETTVIEQTAKPVTTPESTKDETTAVTPEEITQAETTAETATIEQREETTQGETTAVPLRLDETTEQDVHATTMEDVKNVRGLLCYNCTGYSMDIDGDCYNGTNLDPSLLVECKEYEYCETRKLTQTVGEVQIVRIQRSCTTMIPVTSCSYLDEVNEIHCVDFCVTDHCNNYNELRGEANMTTTTSGPVVTSSAQTITATDGTPTTTTTTEGSPLMCYNCSDFSGACFDDLRPFDLVDCPSELPYCGVLKIEHGNMVMFERNCIASPINACEVDEGYTSCTYSCETSGCNWITTLPGENPTTSSSTSKSVESASPANPTTSGQTRSTTISTVKAEENSPRATDALSEQNMTAQPTALPHNATAIQPETTTSGAQTQHAVALGHILAILLMSVLAF